MTSCHSVSSISESDEDSEELKSIQGGLDLVLAGLGLFLAALDLLVVLLLADDCNALDVLELEPAMGLFSVRLEV